MKYVGPETGAVVVVDVRQGPGVVRETTASVIFPIPV